MVKLLARELDKQIGSFHELDLLIDAYGMPAGTEWIDVIRDGIPEAEVLVDSNPVLPGKLWLAVDRDGIPESDLELTGLYSFRYDPEQQGQKIYEFTSADPADTEPYVITEELLIDGAVHAIIKQRKSLSSTAR
jgi:hypothetical protein